MPEPDSLRLCDLTVRAGNRLLADRLTLTVAPGEWLCILGPNGAGKTLTLRTIASLRAAESGEARLGDRCIADLPAAQRARTVAMVPQHPRDAFDNDVLSHVMLARYAHHGPWRGPDGPDRVAAERALAAVGLEHLARRNVALLSGGERQRVAVARAIAQDTPLLLLDEPLSHQDPAGAARVLAALQASRAAGRTLVSTLHDVNLARRHCDRALLLYGDGEWTEGSVDPVLDAEAVSRLYRIPMSSVSVAGGEPWLVPDVRPQEEASTGCSMPERRS